MDFKGLVWKDVWKIKFFGLKSDQDLRNRAAHPHQGNSRECTPPPGAKDQSCDRLEGVSSTQGTRDDKIYGVFLNVKANHLKWFLADTAETKREASHARRS